MWRTKLLKIGELFERIIFDQGKSSFGRTVMLVLTFVILYEAADMSVVYCTMFI
jgi:hypothetical protein